MPVSPDVLYFRICYTGDSHLSISFITFDQMTSRLLHYHLPSNWSSSETTSKCPRDTTFVINRLRYRWSFCSELIFQYKQDILLDWSGMNVNSPLYIQSISLFFCFVSVMPFFFYKSQKFCPCSAQHVPSKICKLLFLYRSLSLQM